MLTYFEILFVLWWLQTYTCSTCSLVFKGKEELRVHITSHTGDMPYKVPPPPNLWDHQEFVPSLACFCCCFLKCSTCPEQFVYKKNLTHHMMKVHGHAKPHAVSLLCALTMCVYGPKGSDRTNSVWILHNISVQIRLFVALFNVWIHTGSEYMEPRGIMLEHRLTRSP